MTAPNPPQQPPVMHGYPAQPPRGDWAPPPAEKRGPLPWLIGALVVAVLAAAGAFALAFMRSDRDKPSPSAPTAQPATSTAAAPGPDVYAQQACEVADRAFKADRLMTKDVLAAEGPARDTSNAEIKAAGAELLKAYRAAVTARAFKADDAVAKEIAVTTAALNMSTACIEAGVQVG